MAWTTQLLGTGRIQFRQVSREIIASTYGALRHYNTTCTGASFMEALLGPDLGDGMRRGSATNQQSLQPVMGWLNTYSNRTWVAGHLLNADLGGSGTNNQNLTALTSTANANHSTFEDHVKRMLAACHNVDSYNRGHTHWYGVRYRVDVDATQFASTPHANDVHSYAYSHITLTYGYRRIDKATGAAVVLPATDPFYATLTAVPLPTFTAGTVIIGALGGPVTFGPIQIHNT